MYSIIDDKLFIYFYKTYTQFFLLSIIVLDILLNTLIKI